MSCRSKRMGGMSRIAAPGSTKAPGRIPVHVIRQYLPFAIEPLFIAHGFRPMLSGTTDGTEGNMRFSGEPAAGRLHAPSYRRNLLVPRQRSAYRQIR
jgi:hypothetical protein